MPRIADEPSSGSALIDRLLALPPEQVPVVVADLPDHLIPGVLAALDTTDTTGATRPTPAVSPLAQAQALDPGYRSRPHLEYLADRLRRARDDVLAGQDRKIAVSMPPRMGKSTLSSIHTPLWLLAQDPSWRLGLVSHSPDLATSWGRQVRRAVEDHGAELGLRIARDAGAVHQWETTDGGGVLSRSLPGQSIVGRGFRVLMIDDPVKDYAAAHSAAARQAVWDWYLSNAVTRMEPPSLTVVIGTRWHADDLIGRLLSPEWEGDPDEWEVISFPAIAEAADVLGRAPGEPLLSPLVPDETPDQAVVRWEGLRRTVGEYTWAAQFQQRPAPAEGALFEVDAARYWTRYPGKARPGLVVYLDPDDDRQTADGGTPVGDPVTDGDRVRTLPARWVDSWDMAFKATAASDYVVGQRWMRRGPYRYLIEQTRGRWTFTQTLPAVRAFSDPTVRPYAARVGRKLVEDKANGTAILDVLRAEMSGLRAVNPRDGKEARARAVTPEWESGHVLLPNPADPGNEWVRELVEEFREFPSGAHDDQVDAGTQALQELQDNGMGGGVSVPDRSAAAARLRTPRVVGPSAGVRFRRGNPNP